MSVCVSLFVFVCLYLSFSVCVKQKWDHTVFIDF